MGDPCGVICLKEGEGAPQAGLEVVGSDENIVRNECRPSTTSCASHPREVESVGYEGGIIGETVIAGRSKVVDGHRSLQKRGQGKSSKQNAFHEITSEE